MLKSSFVIGSWLSRTLYPLTILILIRIIYKNVTKQAGQNNKVGHNIYQTWLNRFSLSSMVCIAFTLFFGITHKIPVICLYLNAKFAIITWTLSRLTVTFYQIMRLKYCFSSQQVHSSKYGYNNWIFRVLFLWVTMLVAFMVILTIIGLRVSTENEFGCKIKEMKVDCLDMLY